MTRESEPTAPQSPRPWWTLPGLPAAAIVLLSVVVNFPALRGKLIFEDDRTVTGSAVVRAPEGIGRAFQPAYRTPLGYAPLSNALLWTQWHVWERSAAGYRLVSLALHIGAALLLWRLLTALSIPGAALAAMAFAVHPLSTLTVSWVSQQPHALAAALVFGSLLAWIWFEDRPSGTAYGVSLLLCVLASLALPLLGATIAPLILLTIALRRKPIGRPEIVRLLPFFIAGLFIATLAWRHDRATPPVLAVDVPLAGKLAAAGSAVWFYLGKALVPRGMSFMYPPWQLTGGPMRLLPLAALAAGLGLLWAYRRTVAGLVLAGATAFILLLLPHLGLIRQEWMAYSFVADQWNYPALAVPIAMLIAGAAFIFRDQSVVLRAGLALMFVGGLAYAGFGRARLMGDEAALWDATIAANPAAEYPGLLRMARIEAHTDPTMSAARLRRVLEIDPDSVEATALLGEVFIEQGKLDEAELAMRRVIELAPNSSIAHRRLGKFLSQRNKFDAALPVLEEAVRLLDPATKDAELHAMLGTAMVRLKQYDRGIAQLRRALEVDPAFLAARYSLAAALAQTGQVAEAIQQMRMVVDAKPDFLDSARRLAMLERQAREAAPTTQP